MSFQQFLPLNVINPLICLIVNFAIHFHNQPSFDANKIYDEAFDSVLSPKLCPINTPITNTLPE